MNNNEKIKILQYKINGIQYKIYEEYESMAKYLEDVPFENDEFKEQLNNSKNIIDKYLEEMYDLEQEIQDLVIENLKNS